MKKNLVAILMIICSYGGKSQNPRVYNNYTFLNGDVSLNIAKYISNKTSHNFDSLNLRSVAFITFVVDKTGMTDSIICNMGTPEVMSKVFIDAVKNTDGHWKVNDLSKEKSQRFLISFAFDFSQPGAVIKDSTFTSVYHMLDFYPNIKKLGSKTFYFNPFEAIVTPTLYFMGAFE